MNIMLFGTLEEETKAGIGEKEGRKSEGCLKYAASYRSTTWNVFSAHLLA